MSESVATARTTSPSRPLRGILLSTLAAAVVAGIANAIIATVALAAGADTAIAGLTAPLFIPATIVGVLFGAVGWWVFARFAKRPGRVLAILVPVVLVLSLLPLAGLASMATISATITAAVGLAIMHIVTVAVAVPVYRTFLPLGR